MPNNTYRLYPKATEDLESIYLHSTREFGIKRTEDYILAIEASFKHLADDPVNQRAKMTPLEGKSASKIDPLTNC
jgi:toxin ParE1/3/4